jgi:CheY-like chemotaxis protein
MKKILIADDQVPRGDLHTKEAIRSYYSKEYNDPEFADGFVFLYKMIKTLKARGYSVDAVNNPKAVLKAVRKEQYDAIVLDLGWWTVTDMEYDDKMILGWSLSEQLKEHSSAPIIMFSNRFFEDENLSRTAAENGLLPVYKSFDDACLKQAIVTIRYVTMKKPFSVIIQERQTNHAFKMYMRLSTVLLWAIVLSVVLLLVSVVLTIKKPSLDSTVSSIFGFILTFINGAIFKYIKQYKKDFLMERNKTGA